MSRPTRAWCIVVVAACAADPAYTLQVNVQGLTTFRLLADGQPMKVEPFYENPAQARFSLERSYRSYDVALDSPALRLEVIDGATGERLSVLEVRPGECERRWGGDIGIGTLVKEAQDLDMKAGGVLGQGCVACWAEGGAGFKACP